MYYKYDIIIIIYTVIFNIFIGVNNVVVAANEQAEIVINIEPNNNQNIIDNNGDNIPDANCQFSFKEKAKVFFEKIGTRKGIAYLTFSYGMFQGVSNFLWGFNWRHFGVSESATAIIQEVGGLSASAECFIFGALVPLSIYVFYHRHPDVAVEINEVDRVEEGLIVADNNEHPDNNEHL